MVVHWARHPGPRATISLVLNAAGALGTSVALVIVVGSKFLEGAWISVLIMTAAVVLFARVRSHYDVVTSQLSAHDPMTVAPRPLMVVVPLKRWSLLAKRCLDVGMSMSKDVVAVHLPCETGGDDFVGRWAELVEGPAIRAGVPPPHLVCLDSPFREIVPPLVRFARKMAREHPDRMIAVVVPRLVERRWWYYLLHNGTPTLLRTLLALRGGPQVMVVDVPWHLAEADEGIRGLSS
jgi:hypothetical protein